ncbi:hypothetical protein PGB90_004561 [Kerria lacca]
MAKKFKSFPLKKPNRLTKFEIIIAGICGVFSAIYTWYPVIQGEEIKSNSQIQDQPKIQI